MERNSGDVCRYASKTVDAFGTPCERFRVRCANPKRFEKFGERVDAARVHSIKLNSVLTVREAFCNARHCLDFEG